MAPSVLCQDLFRSLLQSNKIGDSHRLELTCGVLIRLTIKLNEVVLTYGQTCEFAKVYRDEIIQMIENECSSLAGKKLPAPFNKLGVLKKCGPTPRMLAHFLWYLCYTTDRDMESVFAFQKHAEKKKQAQKEFHMNARNFMDFSLSSYIELDDSGPKVERLNQKFRYGRLSVIEEELEHQIGELPIVGMATATSDDIKVTKDANLNDTKNPDKVMFTIRDNTRTSQLTNEQNFAVIQQQYTKTMNGTMFRSYTNK